jgi:hypothetical protein
MKKITIDDELRKKLMYLTTPLELCDKEGHVLARLTPSTPWNDPENWEALTPDISEEELQRRLNSDEPTYSTQELIEKIKRANGA